VRETAEAVRARLQTLRDDLRAERTELFEQIARERSAAIEEARLALQSDIEAMLKDAEARLAAQRAAAIQQFFDSLSGERKKLLDDIESRQASLRSVMNDLRATIESSNTLATELTKTIDAMDRVVSRFDSKDRPDAEPLKISDVRDVVVEAGKTADRIAAVLERTNELADSKQLDQRIAMLTQPGEELIDRIFWRGVILIALLVGGLACVRLIPSRVKPAAV
jgi:Zn-dependent M32 family carboxypeptidase